MKNVIVFGSSGHSKVVVDIIEHEKRFNIVGFCDSFRSVGEETSGYVVLGNEDDLPNLIVQHAIDGVIVAIGDNSIRLKVARSIQEICPNLEFVSAVHPSSSIAKNVVIGKGSVVMAGVVINSHSVVGEFCILNTLSSLDHDSTLADFASLAPGARTGGNCNIGMMSVIGIGAVLIHNINVGEESIVGAGSTVTKDIDSLVVAYGTPAKIIRTRKSGERYL